MSLEAIAAQIGALRATVGSLQAQIDALATVLDGELQARQAAAPGPCLHEDRDFIGTLGTPEYRCKRCGQTFVPADEAALAAGCRD